MKFLVIGKIKDIFFTLPPTTRKQLMEASVARTIQNKKEGKLLDIYNIPGGGRSAMILKLETAEEMSKYFQESPFASYMDYEIYPLADFNLKPTIEGLKETDRKKPSTTK